MVSDGFPMVSDGFPMVSDGFPMVSFLVFPGFFVHQTFHKAARRAGGTPASPPSESLILPPGAVSRDFPSWEFHHLMWI